MFRVAGFLNLCFTPTFAICLTKVSIAPSHGTWNMEHTLPVSRDPGYSCIYPIKVNDDLPGWACPALASRRAVPSAMYLSFVM